MKLHKLISRTVLATALLGTAFGGLVAGNNASADSTGPIGAPASSGNGNSAEFNKKSDLTVNNGLLTLDNVPTLNFNNKDSNNGSNILKLDTSDQTNNARLLEVTDYRKNSGSNNWQLTADMNPVTENGSNNNQKINTQWEIDLFNTKSGVYNNLDNKSKPTVQDTKLLSNNNPNITNGNTSNNPVMSKSNDGTDNGYGVNQLNYNDSSDAQLITPNVAPTDYSTQINWHLTTNVSSVNNVGNNETKGNNG